jgi:16S rRNA (adenine1518-N6/adenine1519-N6)-dimethyltransferase
MADDSHSPKRLLDERGLRPRKRFGQNFLVDPRFAARVASAIPDASFVVEIGGGTGALTDALRAHARAVVVLEIDRDLVVVLRERFADVAPTIDVRETDALTFDLAGTLAREAQPRAICGNLPYHITTPLIERVVDTAGSWEVALLMVQREYAKRLAARPGSPEYGSITVFVGYHCTVEKLFDVGPAGFYPVPAVASCVVRLTPRPNRAAGVRDEALLMRVVRAAFAQRRKTLSNCLAARASDLADRRAIDVAIRSAGIDPGIRGERLSLDDYVRLANALSEAAIAIT